MQRGDWAEWARCVGASTPWSGFLTTRLTARLRVYLK